MRSPFVAGNWKMNLTRAESIGLTRGVAEQLGPLKGTDVAVCPPFVYLEAVIEAAGGTSLGVGAQNLYHEPSGAFTGEISAPMLCDLGCQYVILGHSERRNILGESNADVNRKLTVALAAGLIPIVCVGELLSQREAGETLAVIKDQLDGSFAGMTPEQISRTVIAYEPVWAIGTGKVATPDQAEEVHRAIRDVLQDQYGDDVAAAVRIQYGGSVKPDNAAELMSQPNIDGALVGGASLKAESFVAIVQAAAACRTA